MHVPFVLMANRSPVQASTACTPSRLYWDGDCRPWQKWLLHQMAPRQDGVSQHVCLWPDGQIWVETKMNLWDEDERKTSVLECRCTEQRKRLIPLGGAFIAFQLNTSYTGDIMKTLWSAASRYTKLLGVFSSGFSFKTECIHWVFSGSNEYGKNSLLWSLKKSLTGHLVCFVDVFATCLPAVSWGEKHGALVEPHCGRGATGTGWSPLWCLRGFFFWLAHWGTHFMENENKPHRETRDFLYFWGIIKH